jgi:hypothetical protein
VTVLLLERHHTPSRHHLKITMARTDGSSESDAEMVDSDVEYTEQNGGHKGKGKGKEKEKKGKSKDVSSS